MLEACFCVMRRDLRLAFRRQADVANTLIFFIISASLFPFGVGPEQNLLRAIGPGVVWVAALLSSMLALGRLFEGDHADGTLDQMLLAHEPLTVLVFGKVISHWLISGLPLVLMAPVLGLLYGLSGEAISFLCLSLLLGTPVLSLVGAVGAALTLGLRGGGVLVSLLVLPLYVPVLIFGAGAVATEGSGSGPQAHFLLLGAFLVVALVFAPWASAAALRISVE